MGIIKVPEGTSTTVVYDPVTDGDAPWLWYDFANLAYEEYVTDVIGSTEAAMRRIIVDNKAMRRTRPDEEYQFVATNQTTNGAAAVDIAFGFRTLIGF